MNDQKDIISTENIKENTARVDLRVVSDRVSESFCTVLKKTREKKGLSIREVADNLHLLSSIISALEEGRFDNLPADTYTAGYIRSYAAFLGLNPEGLIKDFKQRKQLIELNARDRLIKEQQDRKESLQNEQPLFEKTIQAMANKLMEFKQNYTKEIIMILLVGIVALLISYQFFYEAKDESFKNIDKVKILGADGSTLVSDLNAVSQNNNQQVIAEDKLRIALSDTTWVTIRDKNQSLIHQSREQKDAVVEITGQAPFYLNLSNAPAATIYFKDQVVDYSAHMTDDNQLREFVITP